MEYVAIMLIVGIFLTIFFGAIYQFYKAMRAFFAKQVWLGFRSLLFSFLLGFLVLCLIPSSGHHEGEWARRVTCGNNLKQFVLFMKMYANDHEEKYPVALNDMLGDYLKAGDMGIFICPSSGHKVGSSTNIHEWTDYAYVTGLTEADPTNCVVMFCLPENHKGKGANVGFLGGIVRWYSCKPNKETTSFQDLTNTPSLFYGTTNKEQLADLMKRTRIIYPKMNDGRR